MIAKNPSSQFHFIDDMIPKWSADGYWYVKAIAYEATTAKMIGALSLSASGYTYNGFQTVLATGTTKPVVCIQAGGSGEIVDCAYMGFVSDVNISGTGTVTTAYSTFTVGNAVKLTDTGHILDRGTSWLEASNSMGTSESTAHSVIGIAMSSGETAVVDLFLLGKAHVYCAAT